MNLRDLVTKYESQSGKTQWLQLKDDGDSALVRFLHSDEEDLDVFEVHEFEVDGFNQSIKCNGEGCHMCANGNRPKLAMYLQMLDLEDKEVKVWRRGVSDIKKILDEIAENGDLNKRDYKIKRIGKKGSTNTTYQFYAKDKCEREMPERKDIQGFLVRVVSNEDMKSIMNGTFTFKKDAVDNSTKVSGTEEF